MILVDSTPIQSEHRLRGVGTYTRNLVKELAQLAPNRVRFAATSQDINLIPEEIRDGCVSMWRSHRPAQVYWMYNEWFLRRMISQVKPTVFHATDFNGLVVGGETTTVATLHDLTNLKEESTSRGVSEKLSQLRWKVFNKRLPRCGHIIAISASVKEDAITLLNVPPEKITVIPHGVDTARFAPSTEIPKQPYVLFMGGPNKNKNIPRILEAFAHESLRLSNLQLFIGGAWSHDAKVWLDQETKRLGLVSRVRHLGFIHDDELPCVYQRATAFLLPSLEEGFGLPILEAMSAGTPVITSDRGALHEVAGDAAVLVNPYDVSSIARAVRDVVGSSQLQADLILRGKNRANRYTWQAVAEKTLMVYESVSR